MVGTFSLYDFRQQQPPGTQFWSPFILCRSCCLAVYAKWTVLQRRNPSSIALVRFVVDLLYNNKLIRATVCTTNPQRIHIKSKVVQQVEVKEFGLK